jgi:hypothetical protein
MASYEDALKKYPDWAWAFNIPEVGDLLRKGVDDPNYDPIPEIMQTNWYRTTQASVRQWDALNAKDPESANAQLREEQARIWDMALGMGIDPNSIDFKDTATRSLRLGWQQSQLQDYLASQLKYSPSSKTAVGSISTTMAQLKANAANYFVTLSDDTAFNMAKSVIAGEHTAQDWTGVWQDQAKQQFPTIANYIDKGITPQAYFAPVQDRIASALEVNPDSINLMDSKWSKVIDTVDDKGVRRPMTYSEVDQYVRSQDEWKSTRQGQQAAADMAQQLLTTFGKVAS